MLSAPANSDSQGDLTTILEGIGEGFYAVDRNWRITLFNSMASQHFRCTPEAALGHNLWEFLPGARETSLGELFEQTMASRSTVRSETESVVFPGRWLAYRLFPLGDGMGVVFRNVTDRKKAEAHRDLLINELHHRVKNTLASVQAIASLTFRNAGIDASVLRDFDARLLTLSNANNILTDENWVSAEMQDVVSAALAPHRMVDRETFRVEGPPLRLRPKSVVALSMALHELSTNAIKYGALSADTGRVDVNWEIAEGRFRFSWRETGGPRVSPPRRKGFGSRLIERGLAMELNGEVSIDYGESGVSCTINAPLDAVRDLAAILQT